MYVCSRVLASPTGPTKPRPESASAPGRTHLYSMGLRGISLTCQPCGVLPWGACPQLSRGRRPCLESAYLCVAAEPPCPLMLRAWGHLTLRAPMPTHAESPGGHLGKSARIAIC